MIAEQTRQEAWLSWFREVEKSGNGQPWLQHIRREAIERFETLGFPTTHDEEWRFTSVAPLARTEFHPAGHAAIDRKRVSAVAGPRLVFVNSWYVPELSSGRFPVGVEAGSLASALRDEPAVEQHLARHADSSKHAFVALNTALFEDGAFVRIPSGVVIEPPIQLIFLSAGDSRPAATHVRNLILVGRGSQAAVVEHYEGAGNEPFFTNAVTEIAIGEDAVLDHYKLQQENEQAFHIATLEASLDRSSVFTSHSISLGGALVRNNINSVLSEGSECTLNGLYLVKDWQHVDNHTQIDHAKPHANSHELYKGILDGRSSAVFNGKILVRKDAQKTDAKQTNKNLVLSEDAVINTKPELQIHADDVRCTHGATIGQLDRDAIFYLRSRGISGEEARSLLTYAFARDIIDRMRSVVIRECLERIVSEKLHGNR